jgi:hypothetical protein
MQQLELFDSPVVFAIHHDRDELKRLRETNWSAYERLIVVRDLINRMAAASKHEDFRYINRLNHDLNKMLAKLN